MPPFNLRNFTKLNKSLGKEATAKGFVNVPIYTYINSVWEDNLGNDNCNYKS